MKKTTKHDAMYTRIEKHGRDLIEFYAMPADTNPIKLCKSLRILEGKANRAAVDYCNGRIECEQWENIAISTKKRLIKLLGRNDVFINGDPRGYALKIDEEASKQWRGYRDMGGYGILAPDLTEA